jgi:integrase
MNEQSLPRITHPEQNIDTLKSKGVSLVAFLDTVRPRKDKTCTVRLQVVFNRIPKYYSTSINLNVDQYLKIVNNGVRGELIEKKRIIHQLLKKANDIICNMSEFTFDNFKKQLFKKRLTNTQDIFEILEAEKDKLKDNDQLSTAGIYKWTLDSLKLHTGREKLNFNQVTIDFLNAYEKWMIKKGNSKTTVSLYTRCIRKVFNDQIKEGNINSVLYPFGKDKYVIPASQNIKKALSINDISKIFKYEPLKGTPEHYYRDLWIFMYLCNGINVKDVCLLKYGNIQGNTIEYERAKTANKKNLKPISISILPETMQIIDMWGTSPIKKGNYIFPVLKNNIDAETLQKTVKQLTKQINKYIKRIAEKLEIKASISTYTARHSYATILMRSGTNVAFISQALGHSNIATTENYLGSFEKEQQKEIAKNLTNF